MIENTETTIALEKPEYHLNKKGLWNPKKFILNNVKTAFIL